jgi:hypothetical protein
MKLVVATRSLADQAFVGYIMLFLSLAAGMLFLPFSRNLALLPAAVLAGWVQIGGL